jgi:NADH dehydrogenase FAD-containing subunit
MTAKTHVVVAGGGFAGLETAFLLRHRLHDGVDITIVSDKEEFLFRPNTIYIPFGLDPAELEIPLAHPARRQHIRVVHDIVVGVDESAHKLQMERSELEYDKLVIATGSGMSPEEVPGLADHGATIWTPETMLDLRRTVERVVERGKAGTATTVLFLIPPNNKCAGPLYEIVFMLETHLRRQGARSPVHIVWASAEQSYIQAFGPKLHEVVTHEFQERGIDGHLQRVATEVTDTDVRFEDGTAIAYDDLVAFPPYVSAVRYEGLPSDDRGFIRTEQSTRAVEGVADVYAPGDAGDFPVKQAFLAFLQADATAEAIAADVEGRPRPRVTFDPVSMCVMEQLDKAVFAQVPLQVTGDPQRPVEIRPDAGDDYKVGVGPVWRLGKKLLGLYLPMRFSAGEPFHAGTAWTMMDLGLKAMSGVMAD